MSLLSLLRPEKSPEFNSHPGILKKSMSTICKIVGHSWKYKDYTNWIKENGDCYDFKASRKCTLCEQNEYLFDKWVRHEMKSTYDVIGDTHLLKKLPHTLTS